MRRSTFLFVVVVASITMSITTAGAYSGVDLRHQIEAYNRLKSNAPLADDLHDAAFMMGFVSGILEIEKHNTLVSSMVIAASDLPKDLKQADPIKLARATCALGFAPLLRVPRDIDIEQAIAIIDKYTADHPNEWGQPPSELVETALSDAFAKPK